MSLAFRAYRLLAPALGALAPAARMFASPRERPLWEERLGGATLPGGCDAWVHAASLGEAVAVGPLVRELERYDGRARYFLTANTQTGRTRLSALGSPVSLAPIDSPQAVARFLDGIRPRRLFLVETELWPHWLMQARAREIPAAVLSARLSARSARGYRRFGREFAGLVRGLAGVLCQSEADAARWRELGARPDRTAVVGNLKNDGLPERAPAVPAALAALDLDPARPLLVLGSVRPREVGMLAQAWSALPAALRERWQVAAIPRHVRASADLREEALRAGVTTRRLGRPGNAWRWDDRPGVLVSYYRAAEAAFVGGSLAPYGGHNPVEPAACGAAVIMGAHYESQREGVRVLGEQAAISIVRTPGELARVLRTLLEDDALRARRAAAALTAVSALRGASARAAKQLASYGLWPVE